MLLIRSQLRLQPPDLARRFGRGRRASRLRMRPSTYTRSRGVYFWVDLDIWLCYIHLPYRSEVGQRWLIQDGAVIDEAPNTDVFLVTI